MSTTSFDGMGLEQLANEASRLRQELIESKRENEKIPALQREHERLKGKVVAAEDKLKQNREQLDLSVRANASLESQLRAKEGVGAALVKAQDKAREAIEERDDALVKATSYKRRNEELTGDLDQALREIDYRKKHTEALRMFSAAMDMAKEVG